MTNDYSRKSVGSIQYTTMCDADGHMVDDGTVWRLGDRRHMFVSGSEDDFGWLEDNSCCRQANSLMSFRGGCRAKK
ncbi:hypothetical protein EN836_10665 [Mesorhizobium sp. M1C.F.Ca.ET.193.01.1.1]|uniref:hypothetical protein n=1 Tax=unclassified Mesorhizobium TaxID=325217 RepID=UPI000FD4C620|nr:MULTISPECIES: hypothetical protein [unclassified Mesorhizobium]TGT02233.1 hypothetical protein EN820_26965 [bacterium M00.F.Ca.ET.177.01.1.1]TGQ54485.1 hypothetical protein EN853_10660 [Mesorhizobium sp. M1C.F.Ca.ET.210.01.1.1]TGQ72481.1 hypothetical protein EN855_010670 [Mesorhizobium sp. M1C.F.Ca.ET.212.01.1.1]TGR10277.1 hypothetical protein EN847_10665 [Mesorhizobium sp. M1C.F.Ca.ET.204.01.1.1]TGR30880.1 hypothetical protein EN839_10665 [Mesorhizobium sp. M1C.F.Ca.ET.196.01.1.1]